LPDNVLSRWRARLHRVLSGAVLHRPRAWLPLLAWPLIVLGLVLLRDVFFPRTGRLVTAAEAALVLSAFVALGTFAWLACRFYRRLRRVRDLLFDGNYEAALDVTRYFPELAEGLGLEAVLVRLLAFDRRRSERVAAATRLFDRLLREVPLPILVGLLADDVVRFSRELCRRLDVSDDQFPLDSLLLPKANRHFAYVWDQVATGRQSSVDTIVTIQLPAAHKAAELRLRLLGVQDDQGKLAYVLGIEQPRPNTPKTSKDEDTAVVPQGPQDTGEQKA
jgi:hypothetical protein